MISLTKRFTCDCCGQKVDHITGNSIWIYGEHDNESKRDVCKSCYKKIKEIINRKDK